MPASKFTQELFDAICDEIAHSSLGLVSICKSKELNASTFYDWIKVDVERNNKYARAREMQADFLADEIIEIADETSNDTIKGDEGQEYANHEWINRSRLKVDARKWKASKLYPKKYGDKVQNEVTITDSIGQLIIKPASKKDE